MYIMRLKYRIVYKYKSAQANPLKTKTVFYTNIFQNTYLCNAPLHMQMYHI